MKKIAIIAIISVLSVLLVASLAFAQPSTRRINSQYDLGSEYGSDADLMGNNGLYDMPAQSTRRVNSNFVLDRGYGKSKSFVSRIADAILDPFNGDGSFVSTRRVSSHYRLNRGYGSSKAFAELFESGVLIY